MSNHRPTRHLNIILLLDLLVTLLFTSCFSPPAQESTATPVIVTTKQFDLYNALTIGPKSIETPEIVITCTCLGCSDTLSINLTGTIPSDYTLTATAPDGTSVQVHCIDEIAQPGEKAKFSIGPVCHCRGAGFFDFAPDTVTVTLKWVDNEISQLLEPEYRYERPNGPNCEPECRIGIVVLDVPQKP